MNATTSPTTARRSRRAITEITDQLDPAAVAAADQLIADGEAASMTPLDLLPSEAADYAEALEIAAPFLATPVSFALAISAGQRDLGTDTMAATIAKATACSDRVAIEDAAARVAGWVNESKQVGSQKVFTHRLASITVSADRDDADAPRLFLVELPKGTGMVQALTEDGKKPFAIVGLFPSRWYNMTDRQTGEIMQRVDLGNFNPARVWAGHGGIVSMLTKDRADGVELAWSYDSDVRNLSWALGALRRLGAIAAARAERAEQLDDDATGWGAPLPDDMPF